MIYYPSLVQKTYEHLSFDYIERILVEWKKRGLRPEDYEEGKR